MNSVNYNSGPTPQMLGAAMMPMDVQNAAPSQNAQAMGGVPQMSPQTLQTMMQSNQYSPGYVDQSGVYGQTLAANGIAPGPSGLSGLMGLGQYQNMLGSACYG